MYSFLKLSEKLQVSSYCTHFFKVTLLPQENFIMFV